MNEIKKFFRKYKDFYETIPMNCKICKEFFEDEFFLEKEKVPYACGLTENSNFLKSCDSLKFDKYRVSSMLKKAFKRIKELERLVQIHETFFQKQYEYDKSLIMERFEKLENESKK